MRERAVAPDAVFIRVLAFEIISDYRRGKTSHFDISGNALQVLTVGYATDFCIMLCAAAGAGQRNSSAEVLARRFQYVQQFDVYSSETTTTFARELFTIEMRGNVTHFYFLR